MQTHDFLPGPALISPNPHTLDLPTMNDAVSSPIWDRPPAEEGNNGDMCKNESNPDAGSKENNDPIGSESRSKKKESKKNHSSINSVVRRERPMRACTARGVKVYVDPPVIERRARPGKREKMVDKVEEVEEEEEQEDPKEQQCSKIITPLANSPVPEQLLSRWKLRSMWELASILNFLNIFRPLLKIHVEFSAEELETALLIPNSTLSDIHIPLLKAIPPVTRMACGRDTWVTVLCRKLRDWWHWVAEGELPIFASHGAEIEMYKTLDPGVRVVILKALCDIRVEQEDIRSYIDNSLKHGAQLSAFRKERIGGDSHGVSYWYEEDEIIGHRLYREIRKVDLKKVKSKGSRVPSNATYDWETVATNLDEFLDVSEKLFSSKNRTEASLGKKLKNNMLSEIEKVHKRKEKLLKKQQRQALLLDNFVNMDGLIAGRSLRDRKPVTYTFDDFDHSINEAIKITKKKQPSPDPAVKRDVAKPEPSANGRPHMPSHVSFSAPSPLDYDDMDEDDKSGPLDRGNRRRQRPQRYSDREFVEEPVYEGYFDSDDDIVGEAVYDEEYLKTRKKHKSSSSSEGEPEEGEGDEEYQWSDENGEDEDEEDESLSLSEDSDRPQRFKKLRGGTRRERKSRSVGELETGLRRSKRATRTQIDYRQYEFSDSDNENSTKPETSSASESHSDATENADSSMDTQEDSDGEGVDKTGEEERDPVEKMDSPDPDENEGSGERRYLDLNEIAPGSGFDDGPSALVKDEGKQDDP